MELSLDLFSRVGIAMLCSTSGTMNLFNQDFGEGWSNLRPFLQNVYKESLLRNQEAFFILSFLKLKGKVQVLIT